MGAAKKEARPRRSSRARARRIISREADAAPEKPSIVVPTMDRAHASRAEADRARRAKEAIRNQRTHARGG